MRLILDYVYGKEIEIDTGVVSAGSVSDTKQYYEVLEIGDGRYEFGVFIKPSVEKGDKVIVQKHAAEGDTPPDMLAKGYALFQASRIMGVMEETDV